MVNAFNAKSLLGALEFRKQVACIPYAGGTDLMVQNPKNPTYLFLKNIPELRNIIVDSQYIRIGAAVTFTEAIEDRNVPLLMKKALCQIAAPAIRNQGTFGGNLGNGSAKADSVLIEFATRAKLRLLSLKDEKICERIIPVENFYKGRKALDLNNNEIIAEVLLDKRYFEGNYKSYYQKVGGRTSLAISRVSFASIYCTEEGKVTDFTAAFGAVSDTVLRFKDLESNIVGLSVSEIKSKVDDIVSAYSDKLILTRGRVSAEYRKTVCLNLLKDCLSNI